MTSNTGTEHWSPPGHFAVHCAYRTCFESFIMSDNFHLIKEIIKSCLYIFWHINFAMQEPSADTCSRKNADDQLNSEDS